MTRSSPYKVGLPKLVEKMSDPESALRPMTLRQNVPRRYKERQSNDCKISSKIQGIMICRMQGIMICRMNG
jgi:ribosomal protein S14